MDELSNVAFAITHEEFIKLNGKFDSLLNKANRKIVHVGTNARLYFWDNVDFTTDEVAKFLDYLEFSVLWKNFIFFDIATMKNGQAVDEMGSWFNNDFNLKVNMTYGCDLDNCVKKDDVVLKEKPCSQCGRVNDVGLNCWYCGTKVW